VTAPDCVSLPDPRSILSSYVNEYTQTVGIIAGLIDSNGIKIVSAGFFSASDRREIDADTIFEIGSISKIFSALVLMNLVDNGMIELDASIGDYLPQSRSRGLHAARNITLLELAIHASGLPRMPPSFKPASHENPFAGYTLDDLYEDLSRVSGRRDQRRQYSNFGYVVLTHILELATGLPYEVLLDKHVTSRLGLRSTATVPQSMMRLAPGHNAALDIAPAWNFGLFTGAGGLYSNVNDLMLLVRTILLPDVKEASKSGSGRSMAILGAAARRCWMYSSREEDGIAWQSGLTGGYSSFIGVEPKRGTGLVILANTAFRAGLDNLGQHLLNPDVPLIVPKARSEVAVEEETLCSFKGEYGTGSGRHLRITLSGGRLFAELDHHPPYALFAEATFQFFFKSLDTEMTFHVDDGGYCYGATVHEDGKHFLVLKNPS